MLGVFVTWGRDGFGVYEVDGFDRRHWKRSEASPEGVLAPGFVDLHIHGAFGIDFMSSTSTEEVVELSRKLGAVGYEAFLPSTVTGSVETILAALGHLPKHDARIAGFHLEGPFISSKYPGAQPPSFLAEIPGADSPWQAVLQDPRLKLITLAPELPGALDLTQQLSSRNVIVSAGHTNATFEEMERARDAGVRHATHTYNAMRPLHHREAGTVGFVLADPKIRGELIYDRIHVSTPAARVLLNAKGPSGWIAVSDSTKAAGMPAGTRFSMWGLECVVGDRQVRLLDGTLAGSGITLLDAFVNLAEDFGLEMAMRGTSWNPREALGMGGDPRVWVEFGNDLSFRSVHQA